MARFSSSDSCAGQIPPERIFLSHDQTELPLHFVATFPWNKTEYARIARARIKQAGENFQNSGFACAIRPEKANQLSFLDLKRNIVRGPSFLVAPPDQSLDRIRADRALCGRSCKPSLVRALQWHS